MQDDAFSEEEAFRDYAFESRCDDFRNADRVSLKQDDENRWYMILRIPKRKPKRDQSFGFEI